MGNDSFWFDEYLSQRTQSVCVGGEESSELRVFFGVPQDSILGHILFSVPVNDLNTHVNDCLMIQYADDTQFIHYDYNENLPELIRRT